MFFHSKLQPNSEIKASWELCVIGFTKAIESPESWALACIKRGIKGGSLKDIHFKLVLMLANRIWTSTVDRKSQVRYHEIFQCKFGQGLFYLRSKSQAPLRIGQEHF